MITLIIKFKFVYIESQYIMKYFVNLKLLQFLILNKDLHRKDATIL